MYTSASRLYACTIHETAGQDVNGVLLLVCSLARKNQKDKYAPWRPRS